MLTIAPYRYHAITANDTKIYVSLVEFTLSTLIIRSGCSEIPNNHSGTKYNSLTLHQTPNLIDWPIPNQQFQSTHPLRVRQSEIFLDAREPHVSIHAPTRGATRGCQRPSCSSWCFNPRTHSGCDVPLPTLKYAPPGFNPRTHSGCDHTSG